MARVLVAENIPDLLAEVAKVLRLLGHDVQTTANGVDALCLIAAQPPFDLLILDIMMPGATGNDVLDALGPDHPPAIVMSGYEEMLDPAVKPKVRRFLAKPFDLDDFLAVLSEVLGTPQRLPSGPADHHSPGDDDGSEAKPPDAAPGPAGTGPGDLRNQATPEGGLGGCCGDGEVD